MPIDQPRHRLFVLAVFALALAGPGLPGCGGGDRPKLGRVAGTVTLDGEPLPRALVRFLPVAHEQGRASTGFTDAEGRYEMLYIRNVKGASVGRHMVRITTRNQNEGTPERVPPKYNEATTLEVTVEPGANTTDFELFSD